MKLFNLNVKFLPHLIAVVLFIIVSYIYFYPVLEGKVLIANDSTVSKIYSKAIQDFREKEGKEPLWTNALFGGMPTYLISTKFPGNLFKHADNVLRIFKMPVSALILAMAGFYLMLLLFGLNPWLAMAGAIAYGFSSFLFQILAAGHNTQAVALAYMAPVIGSVWYAYRRDAVKGALLMALFLALELLSNHPQITYYAMICIIIFIIMEFIFALREKTIPKFIKTSALLIMPVVLAVGINFGFLKTTYEYGKYSMRGKSDLVSEKKTSSSGLDRDYITHWSYGIGETMNLLIPNFRGGSSRPFDSTSETVKVLKQNNNGSAAEMMQKYWGTQPGTDGPHYMGAIVIFLFVLGLLITKGPEKWWLLAATILSVMLAWGKNFMPLTDLFIDFFPGYNKFRAVTMILVIAQFCIPLLGILALRDIISSSMSGKFLLKNLKTATGITTGILLLFIIFPGLAGSFINQNESDFPAWLKNALVTDRKELLQTDAIRSLIFILLASAAIFGFAYKKLRMEYLILSLGLLILIDLWNVDKRYLNAGRFVKPSVFQKSLSPSAADAIILKDKSYYRVLNLAVSTFNDNSPTSYFHNSIGGYHGAKLKRYQELIDSSMIRDLNIFTSAAQNATTIEELLPVFKNTPVLNMLNARYIIYNPEAPPLVNPEAYGNSWFVEKPIMAENANKEIAALRTINPAREAVIDVSFQNQITSSQYPVNPEDKIELVSYQPDELIYKCSAQGDRLAIFSEIYYPAGWKCYVDGKESSYFRANYVLRGMTVPGGNHEIRFSFEPSSYFTGNRISLVSSILLILLLAGYMFFQLKKVKSE